MLKLLVLVLMSNLDDKYKYVIKTITLKLYNPEYGDDRICVCGHTYDRHFDWMEPEDDQTCSCKYCGCNDFNDKLTTYFFDI